VIREQKKNVTIYIKPNLSKKQKQKQTSALFQAVLAYFVQELRTYCNEL